MWILGHKKLISCPNCLNDIFITERDGSESQEVNKLNPFHSLVLVFLAKLSNQLCNLFILLSCNYWDGDSRWYNLWLCFQNLHIFLILLQWMLLKDFILCKRYQNSLKWCRDSLSKSIYILTKCSFRKYNSLESWFQINIFFFFNSICNTGLMRWSWPLMLSIIQCKFPFPLKDFSLLANVQPPLQVKISDYLHLKIFIASLRKGKRKARWGVSTNERRKKGLTLLQYMARCKSW